MPKIGVISLALLLFLGAALIFWPEKGTNLPQGIKAAQDSQELTSNDVEPAVSNTPPPQLNRLETSAAPAPFADRLLPSYTGEDGFTVSVVLESDASPVPDADVYVLSDDMPASALFNRSSGRNRNGNIGMLRLHGAHYRTNFEGKVVLPKTGSFRRVFAEHTDLFGKPSIHRNDEVVEFALAPNRKFKVTVLAGDTPVEGASVALQIGDIRHATTHQIVTSDSDGAVIFEGVEEHVERTRTFGSLFVCPCFPMSEEARSEQVRVRLSEEILKLGQTTVQMPQTCSVQVTVVAQNGNRVEEQGWLNLRNDFGKEGRWLELDSGIQITDGVAVFEHVGIDTDLIADFKSRQRRNHDMVNFHSTAQPGERMEIELILQSSAYYSGTLLGPNGNPLANQKIKFREHIEHIGSAGHTISTDGLGHFLYEIKKWDRNEIERELDRDETLSKRLTINANIKGIGGCGFEMPMPVDMDPGETNLGEITLIPPPILLSGKVVNADGEPIEDARIAVQSKTSNPNGSSWWNGIEPNSVETNKNGEFLYPGVAPDGEGFRAQISAVGFESSVHAITPGKIDVEFKLLAAPTIHGVVLLDVGIKSSSLTTSLIGPDGPRGRGILRATSDPTAAKLNIQALAGVSYTLKMQTNSGETVFELPNILLTQGQEYSPPELQPLDLRGLLTPFRILTKNSEGLPIPCVYEYETNGKKERNQTRMGELNLTCIEPLKNVVIRAYGYCDKTIEHVKDDQTVILEDAIKVIFKIPEDFIANKDFLFSLRAQGDTDIPMPRKNSFDSNGILELFISKPGDYHFNVFLRHSATQNERSISFPVVNYSLRHEGQVVPIVISQSDFEARAKLILDQ